MLNSAVKTNNQVQGGGQFRMNQLGMPQIGGHPHMGGNMQHNRFQGMNMQHQNMNYPMNNQMKMIPGKMNMQPQQQMQMGHNMQRPMPNQNMGMGMGMNPQGMRPQNTGMQMISGVRNPQQIPDNMIMNQPQHGMQQQPMGQQPLGQQMQQQQQQQQPKSLNQSSNQMMDDWNNKKKSFNMEHFNSLKSTQDKCQ